MDIYRKQWTILAKNSIAVNRDYYEIPILWDVQ